MYDANRKEKTWLSRNTAIYCILQVFLLPCLFGSAFGAEYSRSDDFGPVRMTISEITYIVNDSLNFVSRVNQESPKTTNEILKTKADATFESERRRSVVDLPISDDDLKKIPDRVTSFSFNLSSGSGDISRLTLRFDDSSRFIQVSGKNLDQVTGLLNVMKEKIETHEIIFGGRSWRSILGAVFCVMFFGAWLVWVSSDGSPDVTFSNNGITFPKKFLIELAVLVIVPYAVLYLIPWDNILPGCLISRDKLSFLDRNSSIFTFLGVIIPLLFPGFQWFRKRIMVGKSGP